MHRCSSTCYGTDVSHVPRAHVFIWAGEAAKGKRLAAWLDAEVRGMMSDGERMREEWR